MQRDIGTQCPTLSTEVDDVSSQLRGTEARMILEGQIKTEKPETATC